jgi:hypothetical protein
VINQNLIQEDKENRLHPKHAYDNSFQNNLSSHFLLERVTSKSKAIPVTDRGDL